VNTALRSANVMDVGTLAANFSRHE